MTRLRLYVINPDLRLHSKFLSVEWVKIDYYTFLIETQCLDSEALCKANGDAVACRHSGDVLCFIYACVNNWENRLLQDWLRGKIKEYVLRVANVVLPMRLHELEARHGLYARGVVVKKLNRNVLGRCLCRDGIIELSPKILLLPEEYADSVILHELAHLRYPHHGKPFWRLLTELLGTDAHDHKQRRDILMARFYGYADFLLR